MTTSREFLELVLSGEPITAAHLDALVKERVREDEYIDYKSGALLKKPPKERARTVREYLSGFANSDGGVVIFGIQEEGERPTQVDGCDPKDVGGNLIGWASHCVNPIWAFFSPLPRFEVVTHSDGEVLVCAVGRSYNLVPVVEEGRLVYHLRFGDQTLPAPEYMVTDLLLGRRARPNLDIGDWRVGGIETRPARYPKCYVGILLGFTLELETANSGLVWAEQSRWGLVFRNIDANTQPIPANHYLGTFVEFASAANDEAAQRMWDLGRNVHLTGNISIDKPFTRSWTVPIQVLVPHYCDEFINYRWQAAVYLVAKDAPPIWYQVSLTIDEGFREYIPVDPDRGQPARGLPRGWPGLSIVRLTSERPVVGWTSLAEAERAEQA